jgi:hypothetical protein
MNVNRTGMGFLFKASTATAAFATDGSAPIPTLTKPSPSIEVGQAPAVRFSFGGVGNEDTTIKYQILAWFMSGNSYFPAVIASGVTTVGAMAMTTTDLDDAATKFCDTITDTLNMPGTLIQSPANNTMASIIVSPGTAQFLTVETDVVTATSASVYWQMADEQQIANIVRVQGIAGGTTLPCTEASAAAILAAVGHGDYVVSAEYTATITATSIIPTAFTVTLPANLVRIVLVPRGDVYWKIGGAASAATALVGQGFALNMGWCAISTS